MSVSDGNRASSRTIGMEKEGRVLARPTGHVRVHLAAVEGGTKQKKQFNSIMVKGCYYLFLFFFGPGVCSCR
jgi:hypothetical protein